MVILFTQQLLRHVVWKLSCSHLQIHDSENTNLFTYFDLSRFGKCLKLLNSITFVKDTMQHYKYV